MNYKIFIPAAMQINFVNKIHQEGHFKTTKLQKIIEKDYYIPRMRTIIQQVISNCVECILMDRKEGKKEGFLNPIPKNPLPLDTIHMDHLSITPSSKKNYQYILTIIDAFTKFVRLFPTKTTTAEETLKKLKIYTSVFGNPRRIITDRGKAFTALSFQQYCNEEKIELIQITTGIPRGNGQVERIHRIIISSLGKLSIENPTNWYTKIEMVQRALNSTHQRAIQTSPFELLIGTPMKNQLKEVMQTIEEEIREEFKQDRDELRKQAKMTIQKIQDENRKTYNAKRKKAKEYNENDLVAIAKTPQHLPQQQK